MCHLMEWFTAFGFIRNAVQKPEPRVYCEVRPWKPGAHSNVRSGRDLILVKFLLIATHSHSYCRSYCLHFSRVWWVPLCFLAATVKHQCHLKGMISITKAALLILSLAVTSVLVGSASFVCITIPVTITNFENVCFKAAHFSWIWCMDSMNNLCILVVPV